jgi:hypothetical protein
MPLIGLFLLLTDAACLYHVNKTGRPQYWFYIIIMLPGAGALAYFLFELLPELLGGPEARRAAARVHKIVDPEKDLRAAMDRVAVTDSIDTKTELAEECLRAGKPDMAVELYRSVLTGAHASEPDLMLGLARAEFASADYEAALRTLEKLRELNPDYHSPGGHLLYARSLEEHGRPDAALFEYEALSRYFPGQEAKCRYAELLLRLGRRDEARAIFEAIREAVERAPKVYAQSQREWLQQAKRRLAAM